MKELIYHSEEILWLINAPKDTIKKHQQTCSDVFDYLCRTSNWTQIKTITQFQLNVSNIVKLVNKLNCVAS